MIALILPFMILAGLGFLISLGVHLMALTGAVPPGGGAVMGMHLGIFVIWLPAVLVFQRVSRGGRERASWKQVLAGCPPWMRYAVMGVCGYAFLNFFVGIAGDLPSDHGTQQTVDAQTLRLFSGHWMAFYGTGFAILFSAFRMPLLLSGTKCPAGHPVARSDSVCPTCGKALPPVTSSAPPVR